MKEATRRTPQENDEQRRRRFRSHDVQSQRAENRQPIKVLPTCMAKMVKIAMDIEKDQALVAAGENSYDERDNEAGRQASRRLKDTGKDSYMANYADLYQRCLEANSDLKDKGYPVQYTLPEVDEAYAMSAADLQQLFDGNVQLLSLIHI